MNATDYLYFTEEHHLFRQSVRAYLDKYIRPHVDQWEEEGQIPRAVFRQFGEMSYFGLTFPEELGGLEQDIFFEIVLQEELCRVNCEGLRASLGAHSGLALVHLHAEGNAAQQEEYLRPGIRGEKIGCLAITEPGGGSDVAAIQTQARREGEEYVLNGSKTFITGSVYCDYILAVARTEPDSRGPQGLSLFIVDRQAPGVSVTKLNKLGWKASDTGEIAFQDVRVPVENLVGEAGKAFYYVMQHFGSERLGMALIGVAHSAYALEVTLQYMNQREAFGRKINRFQVLRHRIAQMSAEIEMNRAFVYQLYQRYQAGDYLVAEAAMAKLTCTQLNERVVTQCLQMFGGYGFMEDYPLARMYRDSRLGTIGGGTNEILCEIIAKMTIDAQRYDKAV